MNALSILGSIFGTLGIVSILFTFFSEKIRNERLVKMKKIITHKNKAIQSLEQENKFLRTLADYDAKSIDRLFEEEF